MSLPWERKKEIPEQHVEKKAVVEDEQSSFRLPIPVTVLTYFLILYVILKSVEVLVAFM